MQNSMDDEHFKSLKVGHYSSGALENLLPNYKLIFDQY